MFYPCLFLHDTATTPSKWVTLLPMRPLAHDGASTIAVDGVGAVDGVPWPLGSVPIFLHGKDAVHGTSAVAVSCKQPLSVSKPPRFIFTDKYSHVVSDFWLFYFVSLRATLLILEQWRGSDRRRMRCWTGSASTGPRTLPRMKVNTSATSKTTIPLILVLTSRYVLSSVIGTHMVHD